MVKPDKAGRALSERLAWCQEDSQGNTLVAPELLSDLTTFLDEQSLAKGGNIRSAELSRRLKWLPRDRFENAMVSPEIAADLRLLLVGSREAPVKKPAGQAPETKPPSRIRSIFSRQSRPPEAENAKVEGQADPASAKPTQSKSVDSGAAPGTWSSPVAAGAGTRGPSPASKDVTPGADAKVSSPAVAPGRASTQPDNDPMKTLYKRVGTRSKTYGIAFAGLSAAFLVLSLPSQNIVLQVDSVVAFLAAIVLLFKDPRKRVQTPALDALLLSSGKTMAELSGQKGIWFAYEQRGEKVSDVLAIPSLVEGGGPLVVASELVPRSVTPPGRGLAELFTRETGLKHVTLESLNVSLPEMMVDNFGLAESVELTVRDGLAEVVLEHPSTTCTCSEDPRRLRGYLGCTVASSLAVMFCAATRQPVTLQKCVHDEAADTWRIPMVLAPSANN